jgi:hypothetical protein
VVTITCDVDGGSAGAACGVATTVRGIDGGGAILGCACAWGIAGAAALGVSRKAGAAR